MWSESRLPRGLLSLCVVLVCAASMTGCAGKSHPGRAPSPAAHADPLTIYSSMPLQGEEAHDWKDVVSGIQLALQQRGGTAGGHRITYVSLDAAGDPSGEPLPERITANAREAASDPHAIAYLGESIFHTSAVSIPILNRTGLLQVSPTDTASGLTRAAGAGRGEPRRYYPTGRRTFARVVPSDHLQADALVAYMKDEGCSDALVVNDGGTYGKAIAEQVTRAGARAKLEIARNVSVGRSAANLRTIAALVRSAGAGCLFFGAVPEDEPTKLFKAVLTQSPRVKLFGPSALVDQALGSELYTARVKTVYVTSPALDASSYPPAGRAFLAAFQARFGKDAEPYAIYGYEAMSSVLDAITRAGQHPAGPQLRAAVVDAFFATKGRHSVLGTYDIDADGDPTRAVYGAYRLAGGVVTLDKLLPVPD